MFTGHAITDQELDALARQAVTEHLHEGISLTDSVVKAASLFDRAPLTAEHVHRICEKTYHETYGRMFKGASGTERVVSFDPADPVEAATRLMAASVGSVRGAQSRRLRSSAEASVSSKEASVLPRRYVRANPLRVVPGGAEKTAEAFPLGKAQRLDRDVREDIATLKSAQAAAVHHALLGMHDLVAYAKQASVGGASVRDILRVCLEGAEIINQDLPVKFAQAVAVDLVRALGDVSGGTKSASVDRVNSSHPLAICFEKVARLRFDAAVNETAVGELRSMRHQLLGDIREAALSR